MNPTPARSPNPVVLLEAALALAVQLLIARHPDLLLPDDVPRLHPPPNLRSGVWRRKDGGHVIRGRAIDSKTGKQKQVFRVFPDADAPTALKWLRDEQARIRAGVDDSLEKPRQRFAEFAASLFEHKVKVRDIKSAAGRNKWAFTLEHLIGGTTGPKSGEYVPGFGMSTRSSGRRDSRRRIYSSRRSMVASARRPSSRSRSQRWRRSWGSRSASRRGRSGARSMTWRVPLRSRMW